MNEGEEVRFPPADFVRRGPPVAVKDLHRQTLEKWSRVMMVTPRPVETSERVRHDFVKKGPFTLPLAVLREGADKGSKDAWQFFTHPYAVFPEDATFYNVDGKGCLGSRLFVRGTQGVCLYDEVGANLPGAEFVGESFQAALGVLRHRSLQSVKKAVASPLTPDLLELDLDLLEILYSCTLLLKGHNPLKILSQLYSMFLRPSLHNFAWDVFNDDEHDLMRALRNDELSGEQQKEMMRQFGVQEEDFTKITDVKDERGNQAIALMQREWETFNTQHDSKLQELAVGIQQADKELNEVKRKVRELQAGQTKSGLRGLFSRADRNVKALKADAVRIIRRRRELENAFDEIPGYDKVRGLSERVKGFQEMVQSIYLMAQNLIDHNVGRTQIASLRTLVKEKILSEDEDLIRQGFRAYDLQVRANVIPKLLSIYSVSAYLLRRPDSLPASSSHHNVARINKLARHLIEYFRYVRYGPKDLGEAFDSTWGQVVAIEARL